MKHWKILDVPNTNDITAIQLSGNYGKLTIFNVYNDCTHSRNEDILKYYIQTKAGEVYGDRNNHMIWAGDITRSGIDQDTHLFTGKAIEAANHLIDLLGDFGMDMALPKDTPTLQHMRGKKYSRPDNVFCTQEMMTNITRCEVLPEARPPSTDHFPIVTEISLPQCRIEEPPSRDFRNVEWDEFHKSLKARMAKLAPPGPIGNKTQLEEVTKALTEVIRDTIRTNVLMRSPTTDSKRWWNSDLKKMKKELNKLRNESFKHRAVENHPIHLQVKQKSNQYGNKIVQAKRQHWSNFLEDMSANEVWTANKFLKEPSRDGGSPRIPTLKVKHDDGRETDVNDNMEKANLFARTFFPPPPLTTGVPAQNEYPTPLPKPPALTKKQIEDQVRRLSPYKAPGPDEIPNVVIIRCLDLIIEYLFHIFQAILEKGIYYDSWREFITVVLRKPGKPNYQVAKAFRPIALLCTLAKVITAIVANDISYLVEKHRLLPETHFGGGTNNNRRAALHDTSDKEGLAKQEGSLNSISRCGGSLPERGHSETNTQPTKKKNPGDLHNVHQKPTTRKTHQTQVR